MDPASDQLEMRHPITSAFAELDKYESVIVFDNDTSRVSRLLAVAEENYVIINLGLNRELKERFEQEFRVRELPCLITHGVRVYLDEGYEASVRIAKEKVGQFVERKICRLLEINPVFIFIKGTPDRPECKFTRRLLGNCERLGLVSGRDFGYCNILLDSRIREKVKEMFGQATYPQFFQNGRLVGGNEALEERLESGPGVSANQ